MIDLLIPLGARESYRDRVAARVPCSTADEVKLEAFRAEACAVAHGTRPVELVLAVNDPRRDMRCGPPVRLLSMDIEGAAIRHVNVLRNGIFDGMRP